MTRTQLQPGPADDHYHDTLGVDEALLALRLIGPFRVNFDDPEIDSGLGAGVVLAAIPADALVVRAWAIIRDVWTYTGGPGVPMILILGLQGDGGPAQFYNAQIDSLFGTEYPEGGEGVEPYSATASFLAVAQASSTGSDLRAWVQSPDTATAGSADVYAIVAT